MNYLTKLFRTGAVRKTPQRIISRIVSEVRQHTNPTIIEIGAGQGEITKELVKKTGTSNYFAFEIDIEFSTRLQSAFPGIHVLQHDALKFKEASGVPAAIDYFISSIPMSFYKQKDVEALCGQIRQQLKKGGKIIILFTAFWLIPVLKRALPGIDIEPFASIPPYFLAVYKKDKGF
jgi:phospholipid N-methyltransferase